MNPKNPTTRKRLILVASLLLIVGVSAVLKTTGQSNYQDQDDNTAKEKWEYLAVAGPGTTSFTGSGGGTKVRKEPNATFGREAFVLEQHMDKLGANGWELVAVAGPPTDPVYYFKRRK